MSYKLERLCEQMENKHHSIKEEQVYDLYFAVQPVPNAVE